MTAYTPNTGGVVNFETLTAPSVNAALDTYTISNRTTLCIDTDSYLCTNRTAASGSLDTVSFTGTGGEVLIDATGVRVVAYTGGTGNVPAIGTTISQGGNTGYFLGVWSGWQVEPTASGSAMPATGFIKFKNKVGNFAAGAIAGIGATASGADVVGWIEVRGADTAAITVPRIGSFRTVGDWFVLGTTTGVRGQVLPCPTTATVAGVLPGVWIETAAGSDVYERFNGMGSRAAAATDPTDVRGKVFWQTTGGVRIGSDGTNNVGFLPPSGCRVRVPNIFLTCCTRTAGGSGPRVLPSATLTTRQEFITTSAGAFDLANATMNWYCNFSQAFRVKIRDCAISDTLVQSEIASPIDVDNLIVAPTQAQINFALNMASCFAGGTFSNATLARISLAASGGYVNALAYPKGVTFQSVRSLSLTTRANATTGAWTVTQSKDCNWIGCEDIGGRMLHVGSQNPSITGHQYADLFAGATTATLPHYGIEFTLGTTGAKVSGFSNVGGLANVHPYNGLVSSANGYTTTVRNIGTAAAPYNMGTANASGLIFNGGGNNDGIRLQRCYTLNTRTGPYAFVNSDNGIVIENVQGDYADTSVMAGLNATIKGAALTSATTGQVSVYGTHWTDLFTSATAGKVEILCNEPTSSSASQCQITGGAPLFDSSGKVALTVIGDQVTWESPYRIKGHTALANSAPVLTGTNTANVLVEYKIDTGAGFGAWKVLNAANLSAETISASTGFKLKVRATCSTANAGNLLTQIRIITVTTAIAQTTNQYPLDVATVTFTGLPAGCDAVVLAAGTETVLDQVDQIAGSSYAYSYEGMPTIDVGILKQGYVPFYIRSLALGTANTSIPVALVADRNYL